MADKMEGVVPGGAQVDSSKYPVPIQTIYVIHPRGPVNRLAEHIDVEYMKKALTVCFKHYGEIIDIIVKTSLKRKGQAFVVFANEKSCKDALEMNGFTMFGRAMQVQLARSHSDETVKRKAPEMFEDHKRKRLMLKDFKRAEEDAKAQANPAAAAEKPRAPKPGAAVVPDEYVRPNKTLFLQHIPKDVDEDTLTAIFQRFEGFKEVRLVSIREVAFAEFENEQFAITAKEATANTPMGAEGRPMKVTYQRQ